MPSKQDKDRNEFRRVVLDRLAAIDKKLDALILQGPALELMKTDVEQVTAAMADSATALGDATTANQPKP